jgi:hypothetical protein
LALSLDTTGIIFEGLNYPLNVSIVICIIGEASKVVWGYTDLSGTIAEPGNAYRGVNGE